MGQITLREVCKMVGVTRRAVQGYEKESLVAASGKNKYGYLLYDENAVGKIREIKQYQDFGFTLKEIKQLFVATDAAYIELMKERLARLQVERELLNSNIERMKELICSKE